MDRAGTRIMQARHAELQADPNYVTVRQFDNGSIRLVLEWDGIIANYGQVFPSLYKVFYLKAHNYGSDGTMLPDPNEHNSAFATEAKAIEHYEALLLKHTESERGADGKIIEVGNALPPIEPSPLLAPPKPRAVVPPPPPPKSKSPDEPLTEPDEPELGGGAW